MNLAGRVWVAYAAFLEVMLLLGQLAARAMQQQESASLAAEFTDWCTTWKIEEALLTRGKLSLPTHPEELCLIPSPIRGLLLQRTGSFSSLCLPEPGKFRSCLMLDK